MWNLLGATSQHAETHSSHVELIQSKFFLCRAPLCNVELVRNNLSAYRDPLDTSGACVEPLFSIQSRTLCMQSSLEPPHFLYADLMETGAHAEQHLLMQSLTLCMQRSCGTCEDPLCACGACAEQLLWVLRSTLHLQRMRLCMSCSCGELVPA